MSSFIVETHLHTSETSACAQSSAIEQVHRYKELGYGAIFITDHFINGNTLVDRFGSWDRQIDEFCLGYEAAAAEGAKVGLAVWFGLEANFRGTEFLLLGLTKQWLKDHPTMASWTVESQFKAVDEFGGLVIHAHPFREESYIPQIRLFPQHVHAVETFNMGNVGRGDGGFNERAVAYSLKTGLPATGGSDSHHVNSKHGGMVFECPLTGPSDFIARVKSGKGWTVLTNSL